MKLRIVLVNVAVCMVMSGLSGINAMASSHNQQKQTVSKTYKKGKKHKSGMFKSMLDGDLTKEAYGFEFHAKKDKPLFLQQVGFYISERPDMIENAKLKINIYDMSGVNSNPTEAFVSVTPTPIEFEFDKSQIVKDKFTYVLPERIELPKDAMVEIQFVEPLQNDKVLPFKSNVIGGSIWGRTLDGKKWMKDKFASPFFVECVELK